MAARKDNDTRGQIIKAGKDLFSKHGYAGTTLDDISKKVGVKQPTLIYHFKSKSNLFVCVKLAFYEEFDEFIDGRLAHLTDAWSQIDGLIDAHLDFMVSHPAAAHFFHRSIGSSNVQREMDEQRSRGKVSYIERIISSNRKYFCDVDIVLITSILYGSILSFAIDHNNHKSSDPLNSSIRVQNFRTMMYKVVRSLLARTDI